MTFSDINNIDFSNIGTAPLAVKVIVVAFVAAAIMGLGFYFDTKDQLANFDVAKAKETELRSTFEIKVKKAANLEEHKAQLEEMRRTFGTLLRQLPSKTEIPALIVDISQTALASGLEVKLFRPGNESEKEFYAEKPIELMLQGDYHQFGLFASEVAALPRIVTLHNIKLTPGQDSEFMTMNASAKTYRYLDDDQE
ncbi:MAG: type 4a pilus biogenesis protein PilO [Gammaproteobacteria bacterium]|nr:type 4a pilus biogenesis protein PilO [Gammaproteobacteria bacterium]